MFLRQQCSTEASSPPSSRVASRAFVAAGVGALSAAIVSFVLTTLDLVVHRTAASAFLLALTYVSLTCAGGLLGTWAAIHKTSQPGEAALACFGMRGWMFLPVTFLLLEQRSRWTLVAAATAAAFAAAQLGQQSDFVDQDAESTFVELGPLSTLFGLPVPPKRPLWIPAGIAACLILTAPALFAKYLALASGLLGAASFVLTFQRALGERSSFANEARARPANGVSRVALVGVCVTFLALLPSFRRAMESSASYAAQSLSAFLHQSLTGSRANRTHRAETGFRGVILWPLADRSKPVPPAPHSALASATLRKALVIPFRGPYLYFKPSAESPGPQAHVAQGSPLRVSVHTSGGTLLRMAARQDLAAPVPLSCCREIELSLEDHEPGPSGTAVGLLLTDANTPGEPTQNLGILWTKTQGASAVQSLNTGSHEVLRFPIPRPLHITSFTRITVLLFPSPHRESEGRHIAVEQFALIPR